jgi:hypothetical protein
LGGYESVQDTHINVLARAELADREIAADVVRLILAAHPDLTPKRYGGYEPLPHKVEGDFEVGNFLREWHSPVFWTNGRRASGSFWFDSPTLHSSVKASITSSRVSPVIAASMTTALALRMNADLSSVYFAYESREVYLFRYKAVYPFHLGPTTHDIRRSLPDLPWFTVFGPPYLELFGRETLASTPAFRSEPVSSSHWVLQLTQDPREAKADTQHYERARDAAKQHLGLQHFLDLGRPDAQRHTPDFSWSPPVRNAFEALLRDKDLHAEDPPN